MNQGGAVPQFSYHQWPGGQVPPIQYTSKRYSQPGEASRPLAPHYDLPQLSPSLGPQLPRNTANAPLPFVWDAVNRDYFCYEPETTCFVYYKSGRLYYDEAKRQHYIPHDGQRLKFAQSYPQHRTYQSGEIMFFDSRRQDWYRYDMANRRIVWRDQRWWPFPGKLEPPSLAGPTKPQNPKPKPATPKADTVQPQVYRTLPVTADKPRRLGEELVEPRIVEVTPDEVFTVVDPVASGDIIYEEVRPRGHKNKDRVAEAEVVFLADDDDDDEYEVVYEDSPRRRGYGDRGKRAWTIEELTAKTRRPRRAKFSWF